MTSQSQTIDKQCVYVHKRCFLRPLLMIALCKHTNLTDSDYDLFELLGVPKYIYHRPTEDDSFNSPPHVGLKIKINFLTCVCALKMFNICWAKG